MEGLWGSSCGRALRPLAGLALLAAAAGASDLPVPIEPARLVPPPGAFDDELGGAVAISGDTAVVGARNAVRAGVRSGKVCVFERGPAGWALQVELGPPNPGHLERFGAAVAIAGDLLVVGAPGDGDLGPDAGSVHAFARSGTAWLHLGELHAADGGPQARFGAAVDIERNRVLVGAPGIGSTGPAAGAYVFEWTPGGGWSQVARLVPATPQAGDFFGGAVALSGDRALVAARGYAGPGGPYGAALVFARGAQGGWVQEAALVDAEGHAGDGFATAVDLRGRTAVVGAGFSDAFAGAVWVFEAGAGGWAPTRRLVASDRLAGDRFGAALALDDRGLLVGAPLTDDAGSAAGSAYLFVRDGGGWTQTAELRSARSRAGDQLGASVALDRAAAVVGAPRADGVEADTGAAWAFRLGAPLGRLACLGDGTGAACPCGNAGAAGRGCATSAGTGMEVFASGSPSLAADDLALTVAFAPPLEPGLFLVGTQSLQPGVPQQDGLACTGGEVRRFRAVRSSAAGIAGDGGFGAQEGRTGYFVPGATYLYQYWSRDVLAGWSPCGRGANLSPAVAVVHAP